ncbi:MAG: bacteriorhodopsin [Acidimicrobiia bacterium]
MTFENLFEYTALQYEVVLGVLSLTAAVFAAALVYYLLTARSLTPRLRITSYLSAVVMVSAIIELGALALRWNGAFEWTGSSFVLKQGELFANGFRYMNWSIDVPVLLTQLLIVGGITGVAFRSKWIQFLIAGLGMIWTGYLGQFNELEAGVAFWGWGAVSTVFFIWLLKVAYDVIKEAKAKHPSVASSLNAVWILFIVSWSIYPIAYLMPVISETASGVVARQVIYSFADIFSKAVYGVMLGFIAQKLSAQEGYEPAIETMYWEDPVKSA